MPDPRLYLESDLSVGAALALDEAQGRYLTQVLRQREGAAARVFNGRDGEWTARIAEIGKRGAVLHVGGQIRAQASTPDIALLFSPLKRQATDWLVEKATELGVRTLQPVMCKRTVAETVRSDRMSSIAREAAEQTERLDIPEIRGPLALAKAIDGWDERRPLIFADEAGDDQAKPWGGQQGRGEPLYEAAARLRDRKALALLIGPEGGFDAEERRMLRGLSFVTPVSLGPRILRAESAALAALAVIQAAWGDWR
ncbi:MAG TPA: 16S rRNA (uracil(1498)-N(3))-methyltransferase [Caulobacterales bacterium]|jgi:16S rRNA (uracil1498-N3)-methyltransferase|nr:16S rRNA (uracil(1498)-N(3))-methyltransferase [Caulobacterales bacterium]